MPRRNDVDEEHQDRAKRKVHPGLIEADTEEVAIVVNFETSEPPNKIRTPHVRRLRLKTLDERNDPEKIADDIMRKCKYIPSSKRRVVEMLVANLQDHLARDPEAARQQAQDARERRRRKEENTSERASIDDVDAYVELLYDGDVDAKLKGTALVLSLCGRVGDLEHLVQHQTLMGALGRVLQEDGKKSTEVAYNVLRVFLSFSNFVEMHQLLAQHTVGKLCLDVVAFEAERGKHRATERARHSEAKDGEDRRAAKLRQRSDKALYVALHVLLNLGEDMGVEHKMVKRRLVHHLACILTHATSAPLLVLTAVFLTRLARYSENKDCMVRLDVSGRSARFLGTGHCDLVVSLLRLAANLSFDSAARQQMVARSYVPSLIKLLKEHHRYRGPSLKVLYHLSADDRCRGMFAYAGAVPVILQLVLKFPPDRCVAKELAALICNLSLHTSCAEILCSQQRGLTALMDRVSTTQDAPLAKTLRNLTQWSLSEQEANLMDVAQYKRRGLWARHVDNLVTLAKQADDRHDLLVEALGALGNLTPFDLPRATTWRDLVDDHDLCGFLARLLVPGFARHDVVLEVINVVSAMACDEGAASVVASSGLARALEEVWRDKADDAEVVLQLLVAYRRLLTPKAVHDELLYNSRVLVDVMDCLEHASPCVARRADACLDVVCEHDRTASGDLGELGSQVRKRRFQSFNKEYLQKTALDAEQSRRNYPSPSQSDDDASASPTPRKYYGTEAKYSDDDNSQSASPTPQKFNAYGNSEAKYGESPDEDGKYDD